jgi:hypothetical protein
LRFIQTSEYIQWFQLKIIYKLKKEYIILNILSRLKFTPTFYTNIEPKGNDKIFRGVSIVCIIIRLYINLLFNRNVDITQKQTIARIYNRSFLIENIITNKVEPK